MKVGWRALGALLLLCACGQRVPPPVATTSTLPQGVCARAGSELVGVATVARISQAQGISAKTALNPALSDALFAQGARRAISSAAVKSIERAAAARSLLELLRGEAARAGPASQAELDELLRERWVELARPAAVRTTHVVVLNDKPEREAQAKALAVKLAETAQNAATADEFIRLTTAVPAEGFEVKAEPLPFVAADGRTFQRREAGFVAQPGTFDLDFARAANALERPGQLSPVVKSSFGFHVIRCEERAPEQIVTKAELASVVGPEVLSRRAAKARRELLDKLHAAAAIQLERAADDLTAQIKASP